MARDVDQWYRTCLECIRLYIYSPWYYKNETSFKKMKIRNTSQKLQGVIEPDTITIRCNHLC